jgi:flagellar biogenesis protein FliO
MVVVVYIIAASLLFGVVVLILWLCWVIRKVFKDEEDEYNN